MADTKIGAMEGGDLGLTPAGTEKFWLQSADGLTDYYSSLDTSGVVFRRRGLITESTTTRTLAAGDDGQHIRCTHASGCAITIPLNATVALPVGFRTHIRQTIAGPAGLVTTVLGGSPPVTLNLPTGIRPPRFMGVQCELDADITTANYSSNTAIPWDGTDIRDTDAFHDPATNNTRITIPSGLGIKRVNAIGQGAYFLGTTGEYAEVHIKKNGAVFAGYPRQVSELTAGFANVMAIGAFDIADTDYIECIFRVEADTSVTFEKANSTFSMEVVEIDAQGTSAGIHTEFWLEKVATDTWDIGGVFM